MFPMFVFCRFRLRTMAWLVLIAGVMSFCAREWKMQAQSQAMTVERIRSLGGRVVFDYQRNTTLRSSSVRRWLAINFGPHYFSNVVEIEFAEDNYGPVDVTNGDLDSISHLPSLEVLTISHGRFVSNIGISRLARCTTLRELDLSGCSISDSSLQHIAQLHNLEHLSLFDTNVGDAGAATLRNLTKLRTLNLDETMVSHACVKYLTSQMPQTNVIWTGPELSPFAEQTRTLVNEQQPPCQKETRPTPERTGEPERRAGDEREGER